MTQSTLVLIKPDCVQRRMVGTVISTLENLGMTIDKMEMKNLSTENASDLYGEHRNEWYFKRNISHITSGPIVAIQVSGDNAVKRCREFVDGFRKVHKSYVELPKNLLHATSDETKVMDELRAVEFDIPNPTKLSLATAAG